ncbi:MAG: hypothetical protein ACTHM1_00730 [Solirubrobacteraceae bacterium]
MTGDEALAARLADAVRAHPGLTLYRLAILLDVDEQQLGQMMALLADEGRVSGRKQRVSIRWYTPEVPADQEPPADKIRPGMRAWEVLVLASTRPGGITPDGVATHTRMNTGYAYKVLQRLEAHQLVERCGDERRWKINQNGRDLLAREQIRQGRGSNGIGPV